MYIYRIYCYLYSVSSVISLTLGMKKVPLKLVTGVRPVSVKHPSDLESAQADAGAPPRCSIIGPSSGTRRPSQYLFCKSGTDVVFSNCCRWITDRYAFGDDGVDLQATTAAAGGTSPSRAANRSHIARATAGSNMSHKTRKE